MSACYCSGPQLGQTLCPCQLRATGQPLFYYPESMGYLNPFLTLKEKFKELEMNEDLHELTKLICPDTDHKSPWIKEEDKKTRAWLEEKICQYETEIIGQKTFGLRFLLGLTPNPPAPKKGIDLQTIKNRIEYNSSDFGQVGKVIKLEYLMNILDEEFNRLEKERHEK